LHITFFPEVDIWISQNVPMERIARLLPILPTKLPMEQHQLSAKATEQPWTLRAIRKHNKKWGFVPLGHLIVR
jgi:hypothetical protein